MARLERAEALGVPARPFMYTVDQVADMLSVPEPEFRRRYCYFHGVHTGPKLTRLLRCRNINPNPNQKPDWRIAEQELFRWLKYMGFRIIERRYVKE